MPQGRHWSCASEWMVDGITLSFFDLHLFSILPPFGITFIPHFFLPPPPPPPLSDGMSRTGVFITTMAEVERVKVQGEVDIFQTVKAARSERPHMVSTPVSGGAGTGGLWGWWRGVVNISL